MNKAMIVGIVAPNRDKSHLGVGIPFQGASGVLLFFIDGCNSYIPQKSKKNTTKIITRVARGFEIKTGEGGLLSIFERVNIFFSKK